MILFSVGVLVGRLRKSNSDLQSVAKPRAIIRASALCLCMDFIFKTSLESVAYCESGLKAN